MDTIGVHQERGQALIMVALMVVVLFGFVALALDMGNVYGGRRRMQNAADAGALAGARELCFGSGSRAQAKVIAEEYATARNGAQGALVDIPSDSYTVTVVATQTLDTFVAGVIGIQTADVRAEAAAVCGSARSGCGLWPVAFSRTGWDELSKTMGCGVQFYVWTGSLGKENGGATAPPDCNIYYCDVDGDGQDDFVESLGRAWLDFSDVADAEHPDHCLAPGCGADELKCWIEDDSGSMVELPACIAGDMGKKAGVKKSVDSRKNDFVAIPIYEYANCATSATCPGSSVWVETFGCIEVLGWKQNLQLPRQDGGNPSWKDHVIRAAISCDTCETYCGATSGGPPVPGGVRAVSLLR